MINFLLLVLELFPGWLLIAKLINSAIVRSLEDENGKVQLKLVSSNLHKISKNVGCYRFIITIAQSENPDCPLLTTYRIIDLNTETSLYTFHACLGVKQDE